MALPINIADLLYKNKIESDQIEFKKGWNPSAIYHSVCAFANDLDNIGGVGQQASVLRAVRRYCTAEKACFYVRYGTPSIEAKGDFLDQLRDLANRVPIDERGNENIALNDISLLYLKDYLVKVGTSDAKGTTSLQRMKGDDLYKIIMEYCNDWKTTEEIALHLKKQSNMFARKYCLNCLTNRKCFTRRVVIPGRSTK